MGDDFPSGWAKTVAELFAEAKGRGTTIGPPESEWAIAYERSLLRPWARFPLDGEVYEALEDTQVHYFTHWSAPFTGGGDGVLPKSTKVRVSVASFNPEPISVNAQPDNAFEIEALLVPEEERRAPKYAGFSLSIRTADLNRHYRLLT